MRMPTKPKTLRFDQRIIEAFERWCAANAKDERAVLSDLIMEFLKSKKAWPPKDDLTRKNRGE